MRILMVTSSYPRFPGDVIAPFIESIARSVAARGHEVDVVLPHHPDLRREANEPVRFFPYRYAPTDSLSVWGYAQSLEADVRVRPKALLLAPFVAISLRNAVSGRLVSERYDALHAHWVVPSAALVSDLAARHRTPLTVSLHGSDVFLAERHRLVRAFARHALLASGAITACSSDLARRAVALGAPRGRLRTVPYGVDLQAFAPRTDDGSVRARLGVPDSRLLVLAVGRLVEKKGFAYLVEAAARTEGVHLVIAGDGDLRSDLEGRARAAGAGVSFAGSLDRQAVAAALSAADVVAVPSVVDRAGNVDGLPNALLEALAAGRAVVATRVAGIPDVVTDEMNGLLVPEKDVSALSRALVRLRADAALRDRLGREARRRALADLSWDAAARAFEDCYAQAAALDAR